MIKLGEKTNTRFSEESLSPKLEKQRAKTNKTKQAEHHPQSSGPEGSSPEGTQNLNGD